MIKNGRTRALSGASLVLGALPVGSGQHRAVRLLYERTIRPAQGELRRSCRLRGTNADVELELSDFVQAQTFLTRRYDPEIIDCMRRRLGSRPSVVMDVGAHIGLVTVQLALRCRAASIHAFEPHPDNVRELTRNLARNRIRDVNVNNCAVSDTSGTVVLRVADEGTNWHYVQRDGEGMAVPSVTLDEYAGRVGIEEVDVLKLDVEGHEPSVLRGALGLLQRAAIGMIVTEIHEEFRSRDDGGEGGVRGMLAEFGYEMREVPGLGWHKLRRQPRNVYRNVFFERGSRPRPASSQTRRRVDAHLPHAEA